MKEILRKSVLIAIGILYLFSGAIKSIDSMGFAGLIISYGMNWAQYFAPLIIGFEILLGLLLILDIWPRITAFVVLIVTILFTVAYTYAFIFKGVKDCGCMGSLITIHPVISFSRNILIIAGCFWVWMFTSVENKYTPAWKKWVVSILVCISFTIAGITFGAPFIDKNKVKVGEQVSNTFLEPYNNLISKDTAVVFLLSPDCGHCWNAIENVKSIKNIPEFNNLIGIAPNNSDLSSFMNELEVNFPVFNYPTDELVEIIKDFPVLLILENGKVIRKYNRNSIPCGKILRHHLEHTH